VLRDLVLQMKMQFLIGFSLNRVFAEEIAETMKNTLQHAYQPPIHASSRPTRSPRRAAPVCLFALQVFFPDFVSE